MGEFRHLEITDSIVKGAGAYDDAATPYNI